MEGQLILGNTYLNIGMIPDGKALIEKSLQLAVELDLSTARHYQALGEAFTAMADFEQAVRYKLNALDEAEKSGIIPQIVWSRIGVGDAYTDLGDYEKAATYFQSAIEVKDTAQMTAQALQASADMRLGNVEMAQQYFREIDASVASGLASLRMGEIQRESGKTEDAILEYRNAIGYFSDANIAEGIAKANLRLGDIFIDLGRADQANQYLTESYKKASSEETMWDIWYQKGRLFEFKQQTDSAIAAYKKAVEIIEAIRGRFTIEEYKSTYINNKVKVYDRLIKILLKTGDESTAFAYSERARARAFLDMIGNRKIDVRKTADKDLVDQEQDLRLRIQALSKMIQKNELGTSRGLSRYQVEEELVRSREQYNAVVERIKLTNHEYASIVSIEPTDPEMVRRSLDRETALLAFWSGEDYLATWIIGSNGIKAQFQQLPAADISTGVTASRQAVRRTSEFKGSGDEDRGARTVTGETTEKLTAREQLGNMYTQIISPVEQYLTGYKNLGIIPHGALHFLPFQALLSPDGKYFFEKYNLFSTPSASVFLFCRDKKHQPQEHMIAMALGDLDLGDFSGLPGTKTEVDQISKLYDDVTPRYENESTETYLKENISAYEYVHLATHGLLDPLQPLYSYLLFAPTEVDDGLLTVTEVFGLELNARLVVLSACQTGLGDRSQGDEVVGLSRAFLFAGSPAVIVSLWSVADQPTALLMTSFYRNLSNHNPQESLSLAQREVMKQYPAPFYWAPFQLIGRGD
jgi:CHAT domain-containing protein/predicted negative regulator of RcsB-dependent stress response